MPLLKIIGGVALLGLIISIYIVAFQPNYLPQALAQYHQPTRDNIDKISAWTGNTVSHIKETQLKPFGQVVQTSELVGIDKEYSKSLPQKAFEYGRYQYCQQVVSEYEKSQEKKSNNSESSSEK